MFASCLSVMLAQQWNGITTCFLECVPVVTWWVTLELGECTYTCLLETGMGTGLLWHYHMESLHLNFLTLQAVDVVGQAGKPKTITGFQTHTTPVLLAHGERAELATEEFLPVTPILEGFVILRKNPNYDLWVATRGSELRLLSVGHASCCQGWTLLQTFEGIVTSCSFVTKRDDFVE